MSQKHESKGLHPWGAACSGSSHAMAHDCYPFLYRLTFVGCRHLHHVVSIPSPSVISPVVFVPTLIIFHLKILEVYKIPVKDPLLIKMLKCPYFVLLLLRFTTMLLVQLNWFSLHLLNLVILSCAGSRHRSSFFCWQTWRSRSSLS